MTIESKLDEWQQVNSMISEKKKEGITMRTSSHNLKESEHIDNVGERC